MKYRILTTKSLGYTKEIAKEVKDYYKSIGLNIIFDVEKIGIDFSHEIFYEETSSWSFLKKSITKSIKSSVISALHKPEYNGTVLFVADEDTPQQATLRGQHTLWGKVGLIEIYSKEEFIRKRTTRGKTYYRNSSRKTNLKRDTYVLIHEIAHHLERLQGKRDLHSEILKDNFDGYIKSLVKRDLPSDLLPKLKRDSAEFIKEAKRVLGLDLRITSGFRSFEEQNELYAQGRTKSGDIVTNAKGGESQHNYGIAFDIVDRNKGYDLGVQWYYLALLWHRIGGKDTGWGGLWKSFIDKPHFYNDMGYSLKDFQEDNVDYGDFA